MVKSYKIKEYDISEWSCGMKGDYVYFLDSEKGQGFGFGFGNEYPENIYDIGFHSNEILFTLNN